MMLLDIFDNEKVYIKDAWYIFNPNYLDEVESFEMYNTLFKELDWRVGEVKLFGKTHKTPRKECYMALQEKLSYSYSGSKMKRYDFHPIIENLRKKLEQDLRVELDACLANLYRDGNDSNGWHADNEAALGENPTIVSVSLGQTRSFYIKHNTSKIKTSFALNAGSLMVMGGAMQHNYKHTVPKTKNTVAERINLTFRKVY